MSKEGILCWILLAVAIFSASRLSYLPLYLLAAYLGFARWTIRRVFPRLRVERRLSAHKAFTGQEIEVYIAMTNQTRLPLGWAEMRASRPPNLASDRPLALAGVLPAGGRLAMTYRLSGWRRGYYRLGEIGIAGGDPLGTSKFEMVVPDAAEGITIYPPISPVPEIAVPMVRPFGGQRDKARAYEDPSRLLGIRDYLPGDSLRRIHWRATARLGALQVKELEPTVTSESLILLNLDADDYSGGETMEELGVETAASLIVHLVRLGTAVGMATNGRDRYAGGEGLLAAAPAAGAEQAETLLTILARVETARGTSFPVLAGMQAQGLPWGSNVYILTPVWPTELGRAAARLRRLGLAPVPILIGSAREAGSVAALGLPVLIARRDRERGGVRISRGR